MFPAIRVIILKSASVLAAEDAVGRFPGRVFNPARLPEDVGETHTLDLSICYSIVNHHKGEIQFVPDADGKGSQVYHKVSGQSSLSVASQSKSRAIFYDYEHGSYSKRGLPKMSQGRILAVDDEKNIRLLISNEFSLEGFEVVTAASGEEGMELFKSSKFDVVLLDIKLPKLSGIEILKRMKQLSQDTEIIMITGYGDIESAVETI